MTPEQSAVLKEKHESFTADVLIGDGTSCSDCHAPLPKYSVVYGRAVKGTKAMGMYVCSACFGKWASGFITEAIRLGV